MTMVLLKTVKLEKNVITILTINLSIFLPFLAPSLSNKLMSGLSPWAKYTGNYFIKLIFLIIKETNLWPI